MHHEIERLSVDWTNVERAGEVTRSFARHLAADRQFLGRLVDRVVDKPALFAKCERHTLFDSLSIYDAPERGFCIRLHLSTLDHSDSPHDHRFSFTTLILRGEYTHTVYRPTEHIYEPGTDPVTPGHMDVHDPDKAARARLGSLKPLLVRKEKTGNCYSLHHSVFHTTSTTPDTVSLVIRGPAEKRRSAIVDGSNRSGAGDESGNSRLSKQMTKDEFRHCFDKLQVLGTI